AADAALLLSLGGAREASRAALRTGPRHAAQGLPLFVITLVLAAAAVTFCIVVVRRNLRAPADAPSAHGSR
ncbi:MAG TPA: hypothetical protein VHE35_01180, partial [Kofleriaceae bacterium]|nr:hypothetical protein [Kofleriaceae bacterium]